MKQPNTKIPVKIANATNATEKYQEDIIIRGGAFHGFWYSLFYGHELLKHHKKHSKMRCNLYGYSSGSLVACLLVLGVPPHVILASTRKYLLHSSGVGALRPFLEEVVPENATHILDNDSSFKLHVILCQLPSFQSKIIDDWSGLHKNDLIDILCVSCFIPGVSPFSWFSSKYFAIDGGFSRDLHILLQHKKCIVTPTRAWTDWFTSLRSDIDVSLYFAKLGKSHGKLHGKLHGCTTKNTMRLLHSSYRKKSYVIRFVFLICLLVLFLLCFMKFISRR